MAYSFLILLTTLILGSSTAPSAPATNKDPALAVKQAFLVYPGSCITKIEVGPNTRLEFPYVNGAPDKTQGRLIGLEAVYSAQCPKQFIELRKQP